MNTTPPPTDSDRPQHAETACGALIQFTPHTPSVGYHGEIIHFCSEDCQQLYTDDPLNSCLASRLLSGK